jgi:hypothetical protein
MKRLLSAITVGLFGLAPTIGSACEYVEQSAAVTPPEQLASTPAPAASQMPKATTALAPKAPKPTVVKVKAPAPEQKVAAVTNN